jgi:hypothetical protein
MKKIVFCLYLMVMVFSMFILPNTAFATNWVYAMRGNVPYNCDVYIDSDSLDKDSNTIIFWELIILDNPTAAGEKKVMQNLEANLTIPRYDRVLEFYTYDSNNQQINHDNKVSGWFQINPGSIDYGAIDTALKYAK